MDTQMIKKLCNEIESLNHAKNSSEKETINYVINLIPTSTRKILESYIKDLIIKEIDNKKTLIETLTK